MSLAEANGASLPVINEAEYDVIVANDSTGVLYKGKLLVENWNGTTHATATMFVAPAALHAAYLDFKLFNVKAAAGEYVVPMPPETWPIGNGGGSFLHSERYIVGGYITAHPDYLDLVQEHFTGDNLIDILFKGISLQIFGDFPTVIVYSATATLQPIKSRRPTTRAPLPSNMLTVVLVTETATFLLTGPEVVGLEATMSSRTAHTDCISMLETIG